MKMKRPKEGNLVRTKDMHEKEHQGVVDWVGSAQFSFIDQNGKRCTELFTMSASTWEIVKIDQLVP